MRYPLLMAAACALALVRGAEEAGAQATSAFAGAVAARDLPRGHVLEAGDVVFPEGASAPDASAAPVGWITRRVVSRGEPLRTPTIGPAELVRSGDIVRLVLEIDGVELRVEARAMNSAAAGDRVQVRLADSRRFEGIATAPGVVHLDTPELSRLR